jgi:metal-responsive CopG/Arc/MetJ family transcriptional regulator
MQKIDGLTDISISIEEKHLKFIKKEMKRLGIKYRSEYFRYIINQIMKGEAN